jgi:hypothetical protein
MGLYAYSKWALAHLFVWIIMILAAGGPGAAALRRVRFHSWLERGVFAVALGFGIWSTIIFCLGLAGLIYTQVIWAMTLISAFGTLAVLARRWRGILPPLHATVKSFRKPDLQLIAFSFLAMATIGYILFLATDALYPPTQWDAIGNHLVIARAYLLEHRLVVVRGTPNQIIQALNHLLFTWALALEDDLTAQLIEFTFLILSAAGLFTYFHRRGLPFYGLAASFLWVLHPLVTWLATSAYIDVGLACYVFLGLYALLLFKEGENANWLYLALALLAMAAGVKLSGIFFISLAASYALWCLIRGRLSFQQAMAGWCIGFLVTLPWYGFLLYHTGNPLYPMFPQFNRGEWAIGAAKAVKAQSDFFNAVGLPKTIKGFLRLPYFLTFGQSAFFMDHNLGYLRAVGLWPLIFIFAIWKPSLRWWSFWILAYTIFWFSSASYLRYWLPVVPLVGLAFCESAALIANRKITPQFLKSSAAAALVVFAGYSFLLLGNRTAEKLRSTPPPTNKSERREFLTGIGFGGYAGVTYINERATPGEAAFIIYGSYLNYYLTPKVIGFEPWLYVLHGTKTLGWAITPKHWKEIESTRPTWIYILHQGNLPPAGQPYENDPNYKDSPMPQYQLVYADIDGYAFHIKPLPERFADDARKMEEKFKGAR